MLNEFGKKFNVYGISGGNTGTQMGGWFRKEIKTVDDLKGLKMRIGGWAGKTIAKLGAIPQQIAGGDIYPALEKGTIDADRMGRSLRRREARLLQGREVLLLSRLVGRRHRAALLHQHRKVECPAEGLSVAAHDAAGYANMDVQARYDARNPQALKRLVAAGTQLRPFSQAIMEACLKASNEVNAETSAVNADFKKIWESQKAFRDDENPVVAGRGIHLRILHDPQSRQGLIANTERHDDRTGPALKAGPDAFWAPFRGSPHLQLCRTVADWSQVAGSVMVPAMTQRANNAARGGTGPRYEKPTGGLWDETSSIHEGRRSRRCRQRGRRAGHRAVDAGAQMAHDHELAEVARHAVRRRGNDGQGGRRGDRQQVPDPGVRRRRNRAGPAGRRCGAERHRRMRPHRLVLLFRQGPDLRLRHLGRVRSEPAAEPGLVDAWRRQGSAQRVLQEVQLHGAARRQYRLPDGRLVPQGDQHRRRSQGPQDAHRRIPRPRAAEARRRSAADRGRRHLSGAGEGHHRRRRMGRSLRRREARLLQGRAALLLSRLVGRRLDAVHLRQHRQVERAAEKLQGDPRAGRALCQHLDDREIRRAQSGGAQASARQRREAARLLAGDHGSLLQGGERTARRNRRRRMQASRRSTTR